MAQGGRRRSGQVGRPHNSAAAAVGTGGSDFGIIGAEHSCGNDNGPPTDTECSAASARAAGVTRCASATPLGAPTRPASPPPTEQKSSERKKEDGLAFLDPVKPITTREEIDDAIPFKASPQHNGSAALPALPSPASRECVPCLRSISTPRPAARSRCMKAGRGRTPPVPILASGAPASLSMSAMKRLLKYINKHGHNLTSVNRPSIAAALAANPDEATRKILELRREGARASTRKFRRILAWANDDDRLRGTIRFYGSATGRWSGRGPQLQNLKRNDLNVPLSAIDAVLDGDREALAKYGPPLEVIGSISKATLDAAPGHRLMKCDLSSIESRILAGFAGETWKLAAYREFDRTGDKQLEPYCVVARKMLRKNDPFAEITPAERQIGKGGDLAGGFGGSVGAWRRLVPKDERSDGEIYADIRAWRQAHPKTVQFWRMLAAAARLAIRTGSEHKAGPITASYRNETLYLTLPSGRSIAYPQARLIPSKFEDAPPDILFKDNSRGAWTDRRAWFGTLVENVVQGAARDVLAAAIVRLEMQGIPVVLSVHDEVVIEVPLDSPLTEDAFLSLVLTPPALGSRNSARWQGKFGHLLSDAARRFAAVN